MFSVLVSCFERTFFFFFLNTLLNFSATLYDTGCILREFGNVSAVVGGIRLLVEFLLNISRVLYCFLFI